MTSPEQSYNADPSARDRSISGGATDWATMSIDEILDKLATMDPGRARGDVDTILSAIDAVRRAAERMNAMFGDQMSGLASDAALDAGKRLSSAMTATSETATHIGDAMSSAVGILDATRAQEARLREMQRHLREHPEASPSVRFEADQLMTGTYSSPMVRVQAGLPGDGSGANGLTRADAVAAGGGGLGSETARGQAANTVDAGDFGPSGAPVAPTPAVPAGPGPGGNGPAPSATPAAASGPSSGSSGRGGAGGPDGLPRGGQGTANAAAPVVPVAGAGRSGHGAGAGADGWGREGSGTGGAGPIVPLSAATPAAPPPSAPAGAPANPAGQRPAAMPPTGPAGAPPAGRRPAARDDEHKAAPYLNNREHGAEIVGDMPLVGPPVIGDWIRQAFPTAPDATPEPVDGPGEGAGHSMPAGPREDPDAPAPVDTAGSPPSQPVTPRPAEAT
ncbi:hypothetical protein GDN83_19850 [Gordonia jinghuaiqii]|uniref:Uncharacterized protein n=1 Tax=Gordonia jinghuaiqii TaxID=2758710 RepID=A0A7D7QS68_9ACTN|nr:hypothetical protein [Gordonia jinghuaiqii]MCR5979967.1 hypothetical protein [Gordonia jinghuaiqii]QMT03166.1 hypothetical protein H1R19_08675 [Gordonia jinghuaiqii]